MGDMFNRNGKIREMDSLKSTSSKMMLIVTESKVNV